MWIEKNTDNYNLKTLSRYHLPVIENINELFSIFYIDNKMEKMLFYRDNRKYLYSIKAIPKKDGTQRIIEIPKDYLKDIQKAINKVILNRFNMSKSANGFIRKRNIVTNAIKHVGSKVLIKLDIKDFFPSITFKNVFHQFRYFGYGENVSKYLALVCVNKSLVLPQGAPTSPSLSNLVMIKIDKRITNYCKKKNLRYTRYADDITISSENKLTMNQINRIISFIKFILSDSNYSRFELNERKTKVIYCGTNMNVTGVVVNDKLSILKSIKNELDNAIYYIKKYGLKNHLDFIKCTKSNYKGHLYGLASYVNMIDRVKGRKYLQKLNELDFTSYV